jgi:Uma2 family endonuclease
MAAVAAVPRTYSQRTVLSQVSWRTYESLLEDYSDRSGPRFSFDRGVLEIVTLSAAHEEANRTIALFIELVAGARAIRVRNVGSMTYKRETLQRGFEPDSSFYIQNEGRVRGLDQIDAATDPPPDLVIEIDVSRSSLDKLALYAAMGVPEVWRFDDGRLAIGILVAGGYEETTVSRVLPLLTRDVVDHWLAQSRSRSRPEWMWAVVDWARGLPNPNEAAD